MHRTLQALSILTLVAALGACGKSPLTDAQKAQVKEVTGASQKLLKSAPGSTTTARSAVSETDLATRLASCQQETPFGSSSMAMNLSLKGEGCPIVLEVGVKLKSQTEAEFKMFYEIKDPAFAELTDVTAANISGTISGTAASASGKLTGSITSKKHGQVPVTMILSGNESSVSFEATYEFKDFSAVIEINQSDAETTITLNGQTITAEELQELLSGGGMVPGMNAPTVASSSSSTSSYTYTLSYNGCSTGKQTFPSQEAMCEGLQSESLNKGCAQESRRSYFMGHGCAGSFEVRP
jgi:hypothetical protein